MAHVRKSRIWAVEMLARFAENAYELEATCTPCLMEKLDGLYLKEEEISQHEIDIAFVKTSLFLNSVFVGGMRCETILSPHPLRESVPFHTLVVNASKSRTPLTDRLRESLGSATREVLACGWVGQFIIPDLKKCVERGVRINLVTHKPGDAEGTMGAKDKSQAFAELKNFLKADNVRILSSCHARLLVVDEKVAFVGSMDYDCEALAERDEAAIMSEDQEVIAKTKLFFLELFGRGIKPNWVISEKLAGTIGKS